ncbi:DUF4142 domain-containing protein [Bosea sp. (in: a-proteobacteria)]|uniref:DUF4142 domain-containing protein n=1 Tax=Bosea sp. (in: a-proteobacteria) TaxID=1871050 RepID=UPI001207F28F|nr:DUF4142 domain-containing protein [Bosea sp. (in: a-proteobacteria)]TAJ29526.1 MAG: DUF4142 domain-containing protein [Bosea sp. (in: a-proteobacteria)]
MLRRNLIIALGLVLPAQAWAQPQGKTTDAEPGRAAAPAAGPAELRHANDTLAAGMSSLAMSEVAVRRASGDIRQFAEFEVAEQRDVAAVLKLRGHQAQQSIDDPTRAMVDRLTTTNAGEQLDAAYLTAQAEGHQRLLDIQQAYLREGQDPHSRAVAMLIKGRVQEHIQLIGRLRKKD